MAVRRAVSAVSAVVVAAGLSVAPTPAHADVITPTTGAIFNDAMGTDAQKWNIRAYVIDLIDSADNGSRIDVAAMVLLDDNVAQALVRANDERNVHVRVVVDNKTTEYASRPGYARLTNQFEDFDALTSTERSNQSWIQTCAVDRACVASTPADSNPLNHNKFFLFSSIAGKKVIVNSSENLGTSNLWNNAVTLVDDAPLFELYVDYFNSLAHANHAIDDPYAQFGGTGAVSSSKVWFFPRPAPASGNEEGNDTIGDILANTTCNTSTKIKIGMRNLGDETSTLVSKARLRIARELLECAQNGATVEIVYDKMQTQFRDVIEGSSRIIRYRMPSTKPSLHSKYMIIDGNFAGTSGKWIFTGSHNYDRDSLRDNDENLMRLNNATIYDQYAANIERLKQEAVLM